MKKGGSMEMKKKTKSVADLTNIRLPKIHGSTQMNFHESPGMPRVREKLKDHNDIIRTIRKKFDDKLRLWS